MTDRRTDEELAAVVLTACEVIDDEGSIPSRPCTTYADALTELTRRLTERTEEVARLREALDAALKGCRWTAYVAPTPEPIPCTLTTPKEES